jgi:hypothetical protein
MVLITAASQVEAHERSNSLVDSQPDRVCSIEPAEHAVGNLRSSPSRGFLWPLLASPTAYRVESVYRRIRRRELVATAAEHLLERQLTMSNANEPAFPISDVDSPNRESYWGLDKREYFAAMAMQGISANPNFFGPLFQQNPRAAADYAVEAADALLARLAE